MRNLFGLIKTRIATILLREGRKYIEIEIEKEYLELRPIGNS